MSRTVILDPGHGGPDPGAVGFTGIRECDVNLDLSRLIAKRLRQSGPPRPHVMLTHNGTGAGLWERVEYANTVRADLFVSLHCNAAPSATARGFEVWTTPGETAADACATAIFESVQEAFPGMTMRARWEDGDPDMETGFYVLRRTAMPAVLAELGFLTNPQDAEFLMDQANRVRLADAIARGVLEALPPGDGA